jgi:GntR family transcriptional regulator, transcriptional repressor for pyruvate dehydrogenase complex
MTVATTKPLGAAPGPQEAAPRLLDFDRQPVRQPKAAEVIANELRRVVVCDGKPGDYLMAERLLIERFGVSRPTLREALRILESEGLLDIRRGIKGGATIREPSIEDLALRIGAFLQMRHTTYEDLFMVRKIIEPAAVRLAAQRVGGGGGDASVLERYLEREEQTIANPEGEPQQSEAIGSFHDAVLELAGSTTLAIVGKLLHATVDSYTKSYIDRLPNTKALREALTESHLTHRKLADAIAAGQADRAEYLMRSHLDAIRKATGLTACDRYINVFGGVPEPVAPPPPRRRRGAAKEASRSKSAGRQASAPRAAKRSRSE